MHIRMNKYLLYFLFRLSVAIAIRLQIYGWVNPRVCRFIHSRDIYLQHGVSSPTADDIRRYVVASQFAYFKEGDPSYEGSLSDIKRIYGDEVVYTPFFKDGTEKETDKKRQILAGYVIQVNDFKKQCIETVVAFRGTKRQEWVEWKNNMDSMPILRHFMKQKNFNKKDNKHPVNDEIEFSLWVHRGVTKEYDRCRLDFLKKIKQVYRGGELVFVGHSKGIISQLGALDFVLHFGSKNCFPIHLISFGSYKIFAHLPGGDNPHEIFKKYGLHCSRVHFLRDPVVNYPYFRPYYHHVFDTRIYLKQPPNSLMEHSVFNYKRFFMDIPPT